MKKINVLLPEAQHGVATLTPAIASGNYTLLLSPDVFLTSTFTMSLVMSHVSAAHHNTNSGIVAVDNQVKLKTPGGNMLLQVRL